MAEDPAPRTVTSLPLKLVLIGYWYWVLENGLLAFYMKKTRDDIDFVPSQWDDFSNQTESAPALSQSYAVAGTTLFVGGLIANMPTAGCEPDTRSSVAS